MTTHGSLAVNQSHRAQRVYFALLLFSLMLGSCRLPPRSVNPTPITQPLSIVYTVTPDLTATFQAITPLPSHTPSASSSTPTFTQPPPTIPPVSAPTVTGETPTIGPCGFVWARKSLPELSEQVRTQLEAAGLPVLAANAEAYGEDCLYSDGTLAYFAAMETDYRIMLAVSDLTETSALGDLLTQTLTVIDQFPVGETPGPMPGYIGITFQAGEQIENLWFNRAKSDELRSQGLSGVNLYDALKLK